MARPDWLAWHEQYRDPTSGPAQRLPVVQRFIRRVLDEGDGQLRAVSLCAGDGRDLLGVLAEHPRGATVRARLVELEPGLAETARVTAAEHGLGGIEVVCGDAALTDAYIGAVPADLVLVCGVFGNVSDADVERTVNALPELCAPRAVVVWTRHRRDPDLTPAIRAWFGEAGFDECGFEASPSWSWAVGMQRLRGAPRALRPGVRLFTFASRT